ncbi:MAG: hypothetical protein EXR60_05510 [Dehalococcoidia bacterium]|nr:hypothetical protein [Dehalococcoidia bacterium]
MPERPPPGPVQGEIWQMIQESQQRRLERRGRAPQFSFLADPQDILSLNMDGPVLSALEGLSRVAATRAYRDAALSALTIAVRPFVAQQDLRGLALFTYSTVSGRTRVTMRVDSYGLVEPAAPSEDSMANAELSFLAPPWEPDPGWRAVLRQAYATIEPLSPHEFSAYYVSARARFAGRWEAIFQDGKSGREAVFEWTSAADLTRRK